MTAESEVSVVEKDRKKRGSAISGGIFLISLGVLIITDWWWPGIMFALGLSGGAELIFRGKIWRGLEPSHSSLRFPLWFGLSKRRIFRGDWWAHSFSSD